jgi:hypothetical protein
MLACLLGVSGFLYRSEASVAQNQSGAISGTLTETAGGALRGAAASIPDRGMTVATDQQGRFFFSGLAAGNYTLAISYIGFEKLTKIVAVTARQATTGQSATSGASDNQTVIVRASAASAEVEAVNEGRTADNVLQVMPVQTITNLPSSNQHVIRKSWCQ